MATLQRQRRVLAFYTCTYIYYHTNFNGVSWCCKTVTSICRNKLSGTRLEIQDRFKHEITLVLYFPTNIFKLQNSLTIQINIQNRLHSSFYEHSIVPTIHIVSWTLRTLLSTFPNAEEKSAAKLTFSTLLILFLRARFADRDNGILCEWNKGDNNIMEPLPSMRFALLF